MGETDLRTFPRRTNEAGVALIRTYEGLSLQSYLCPAGLWTVGYGHTATAKPFARITLDEAERLLRQDLVMAERAVAMRVEVALNDNQFAALVSFVFNVGEAAFARSSLLKKLNAGDYSAVPKELGRWVRAQGIKLEGLVRRRNAEIALWLKTDAAKSF